MLANLLPFTLKMKNEFEADRRLPHLGGVEQAPREITAFGGLRAFFELADALGLQQLVDESITIKERERRYRRKVWKRGWAVYPDGSTKNPQGGHRP